MVARFSRRALGIFFLLLAHGARGETISLAPNDPLPPFSTIEEHTLLLTGYKNEFRSYATDEHGSFFQLSISPFRQTAKRGEDLDKNKVDLGDIHGRWNMLGLFYDPTAQTILTEALNLSTSNPCYAEAVDPNNSDLRKEFGFFSIPMQYRKYGVRFEGLIQLGCDVGLRIQTGVASIRQTTVFNDLTCTATGFSCPDTTSTTVCTPESFSCACKTFVIDGIMQQKDTIAKTLGLDLRDFNKTAMEDIHMSLYWRRPFAVNQDNVSWPFFFFTPFLMANVSIPTANSLDHTKLFALSTGNNGHFGAGVTGGISFDFVETIEVIAEAGMMHFFSKKVCNLPVPTNKQQSGIFPRTAFATVSPGDTWNFSLTMNAYHFIDRLSAHAQYAIVSHRPDLFCIHKVNKLTPTDPITPQQILTDMLSEQSSFDVHVANLGFNYDLSPHMSVGFLWQLPLGRRNAYRSTTIMGSFSASY